MSTILIETCGMVRVLRMARGRGNALDPGLVGDLYREVGQAAADDAVGAVVLASAHASVFSPGLDLFALGALDRAALEVFMNELCALFAALYGLEKPLVAAVRGHAIAGGCVLAATADHRVLGAPGAQIGLREAKVGVPLPWTVAVLLRAVVPPSALNRVALFGNNAAGAEALALGLADELAPVEDVEARALERAAELASRSAPAFALTKAALRREAVEAMARHRESSVRDFVACWFHPATQARLAEAREALRR